MGAASIGAFGVRLVVMMAVCAVPRFAAAQGTADTLPDPNRGAASEGNPKPERQIELKWTALGGYDDGARAVPSTGQGLERTGTFGMGSATLGYANGGRRKSFTATATAAGEYSPGFPELTTVSGNGDASFTTKLGNSATLSAFGSARYQPYYQFTVATEMASSQPSSLLARNEAVTKLESHGSDGRIQLSEKLGRRTALNFDYGYRYTQLSDNPEAFLWQVANGRLVREVTKRTTLRLGYGYGNVREGFGTGDLRITSQTADVGVEYVPRPRPSAHRPTLSFSSGASVVTDDGISDSRPVVAASVIQPISGTWNVRGEYHRGFQFVEGFDGPLYADTTQLRLTGRPTRRTDASVSVDYSNGQIGLTSPAPFVSYSGTADLRVGLSRTLWLDVQYVRYFYDFDPTAILVPNVSPRLVRQGIRFGVTGWVPLSRKRLSGKAATGN